MIYLIAIHSIIILNKINDLSDKLNNFINKLILYY